MTKTNKENSIQTRPPVVVIMGHVDHGKSTLLDYIRNTNIVDSEAGGITQHIRAYEIIHQDENGADRKISFIDTPGHAAFSKMRKRGANIADIAILIVSAEDGVKPQTIEAWKTIEEAKIPVIVAINKIDKPGANVEKTKMELSEHGVYLENYGGNIPFIEISAKAGTNIPELLSLITIVADLEDFKGDKNQEATGFIIEANLDQKRGIEAVMIIKNGTLKKGMWVLAGNSHCPVRILEDFKGKATNEATFSAPIRLIGFDKMPKVGSEFVSFHKKTEMISFEEEVVEEEKNTKELDLNTDKKIIPIVLKADTSGSIEAIEKEIEKIEVENARFKIIQKGEGTIGEKDIKNAISDENAIVLGFNVKSDNNALSLAERMNIQIMTFDIIYKMTEWLEIEMENRRPKITTTEVTGSAKILKVFSKTKERQVLGGKVLIGEIHSGQVRIIRREGEIGRGKIINLEKDKNKTSVVEEGREFGMMIESKVEIAQNDIIETFKVVEK
ncbi:MAG: translation initiation factor IF-2 [Candidatus Pacebacteria bacterium]|nr:translation initiation factor IF-2 [Candidatus Paceibacterota bacterium]